MNCVINPCQAECLWIGRVKTSLFGQSEDSSRYTYISWSFECLKLDGYQRQPANNLNLRSTNGLKKSFVDC